MADKITEINIDRLVWCAQDFGISTDELCHALRISPNSMAKLLEGEGGITFNQLKKIAGYFGRGVLFFLEPGKVDSESVHSPEFRTLANEKPELSVRVRKIIERVEQHKQIYLDLASELDLDFPPEYAPPPVEGLSIIDAALKIRDWLQITSENSFEGYRQLLENKGILVFCSNAYAGAWQVDSESRILGFSLYDKAHPAIFVTKASRDSRQTFTLFHELGHLILNKASSIDDARDMWSRKTAERDANIFAGHVLIPDEMLNQIPPENIPRKVEGVEESLRPYRRMWGVSNDAILIRLSETGRVSNNLYRAYNSYREANPYEISEGGNRAYRHREPRYIFGDTYVRIVLDAWEAEAIPANKASKYLDGLKLQDLRKLSDYYNAL